MKENDSCLRTESMEHLLYIPIVGTVLQLNIVMVKSRSRKQ